MNIKDIVFGVFLIPLGNLAFYFMYPVYSSILTGLSDTVSGSFGLTSTMLAIGWGAYITFWALVGVIIPIYLIVKGSREE